MGDPAPGTPLRAVDCVRLSVPDLEAGLAYYRDCLGLALAWRSADAAGLRLPESSAEIVLHTEPGPPEVDLLVDSADAAAERIAAAGGQVVVPPFDIAIGRAVVVEDPWGNRLVLLDTSKGTLQTDADGNVIGVGRATAGPCQPLRHLQVIGVRYRGSRPAEDDERALDRYAASGVYGRAGVPFSILEPAFPEEMRQEDEAVNLGALCGQIAEAVAAARRAGKAVLMTGGDCTHASGVLGGLEDAHGPGARIGLVWFDAHGDFNTPKTTLSGWLGGMPVAVCAGLGLPQWRERAHIAAPLPADRIVLVGPRNLDPPEEQLVRSIAVTIAAPAAGFPGSDLAESVAQLSERVDMIYLHIDADILDRAYVPNHRTGEPDGPDMAQVQAAVDTVMATGKVVALALVSVYGAGEGSAVSVTSGIALLGSSLASWRRHGRPADALEAPFEFLDPGPLVDGDLQLVLEEACPADPARGYVPSYKFLMVLAGSGERVGSISLRVGDLPHLVLYGGHIGYKVEPEHRGHHYAARASRLLLPLARRHGLRALWITCSPDNVASRRTCDLAGARFVEIIDLPPDSDLYRRGERQKCRYRLDL